MKKLYSVVLTLVLCITLLASTAAAAKSEETYSAIATNNTIVVSNSTDVPDAHLVHPAVYKIKGANYFKLRDVAMLLNGSGKQFAVDYDDTAKAVSITSGKPYIMVGGELSGTAAANRSAIVSNNTISINGNSTDLTVFKIDGANYFKLQDIGKALDFYVGYDDETKTVYISGAKGYEAETPLNSSPYKAELMSGALTYLEKLKTSVIGTEPSPMEIDPETGRVIGVYVDTPYEIDRVISFISKASKIKEVDFVPELTRPHVSIGDKMKGNNEYLYYSEDGKILEFSLGETNSIGFLLYLSGLTSTYPEVIKAFSDGVIRQLQNEIVFGEKDVVTFNNGYPESIDIKTQETAEMLFKCIKNCTQIIDLTDANLEPMALPIEINGRGTGTFDMVFATYEETGQFVCISFAPEDSAAFYEYVMALDETHRVTESTGAVSNHPSSFDGEKLYINVNGKNLVYERYELGVGSLTRNTILDSFDTETEIEGIVWEVYSAKEYPDLSYVLVISGTNAKWTYRIIK